MRFSTLEQWLRWQETLHPSAIDLGLERVAAVARRQNLLSPACPVVTVAGTNGKGSSVALLESIYLSAGYRVGTYTSPHLWQYNERIRVAGEIVSDEQLCAAFESIDKVRAEVSLSYFEFGTLAALEIFSHADLDVMLLEVGLGGRLDAVNIVDADAALITTVDIDHVEWLGSTREAIGGEKAGIFRSLRPAICADPSPPASVKAQAHRCNAQWYGRGDDFDYRVAVDHWEWHGKHHEGHLPLPALEGAHQLDNAAGVLQVVECLQTILPVPRSALDRGLREVRLAGRFQRIPGAVEQVLDVAHNPQGGARLANALADHPVSGQTHLVLGMLRDKDVRAFVQALLPVVDHWYLGGLDEPRGMDARRLLETVQDLLPADHVLPERDVVQAYERAWFAAQPGDRLVITGSFHTVSRVAALHNTKQAMRGS